MAATIFNADFRTEVWRSLMVTPPDAPLLSAVQIVPSVKDLERYVLMSMPPEIQDWTGARRPIMLAPFATKEIQHVTRTGEVMMPKEQYDDAQQGEFLTIATNLGAKAAQHPNDYMMTYLAACKSNLWLDGSAVFAARSAATEFGIGDNIVSEAAGDIAVADATGAQSCAFLYTGGLLKPLLYQSRAGYPAPGTDVGTTEAEKARQYMWWVDIRCSAIAGCWWDSIVTTMGGIPTLAEAATIWDTVETRWRGFTLPKGRATDPARYPHGETTFAETNLLCVCSTRIATVFRDLFSTANPPGGLTTRLRPGVAKVMQSAKIAYTNT